jgi:hypothetical protein
MADEEPKIFIDEDWKAQVQREKEVARAQVAASQAPETAPPGGETGERDVEPSSFASLVQTLTAQTLFALGVIAPKDAKQVYVDIHEAKFLIDTLMMLREKTKGNLTPEEQGLLANTLSELQQGYVIRAQQVHDAAMKQAGVDMTNLRPKP